MLQAAVPPGVLLDERIENRLRRFRRDAYSGVGNFDFEDPFRLSGLLEGEGDGDGSFFRELDGVSNQVEQNLANAQPVQHQRREPFRTDHFVMKILPVCPQVKEHLHLRGQLLQFCRLRRDLHLLRVDFAEVENVVDQLEQRVPGQVDRLQILVELLGLYWIVAQELAETDDGVERGAQFMAHCRQKQVPGFIVIARFEQFVNQPPLRLRLLGDVDQGLERTVILVAGVDRPGAHQEVAPVQMDFPAGFPAGAGIFQHGRIFPAAFGEFPGGLVHPDALPLGIVQNDRHFQRVENQPFQAEFVLPAPVPPVMAAVAEPQQKRGSRRPTPRGGAG